MKVGTRPYGTWSVLSILPLAYLAVEFTLRAHSGPFWVWHVVDPSYFYLLDFLNLVNLETPGHPYHPGTPVQVLGALVLRVAYPFSGSDEIVGAVLEDPEFHLHLVSTVIIVLNAAAMAVAGMVSFSVFRHLLPALLLETGPFLSMLIVKNGFHVKPEPILVFSMVVLATVAVAALRPGALENDRGRFAVAFGIIAGFGVATKITCAPLFVLPVFLLGNVRTVLLYAVASAAALALFLAPAAGALPVMVDWFSRVSMGSGAFGGGESTIIDFARYPASVVKLFSRPVVHGVFLLSLVALAVGWWRKRAGKAVPGLELRLLAGLSLALLLQVLVVAKQPSGHYMIPAFVLGALGIAVLFRTAAAFAGAAGTRRWTVVFSILLAALVVAQSAAIVKLDREFRERRDLAFAVDDDDFRQCTRIWVLFASNPTYALFLGNFWTAQKLAPRLAARTPPGDFWYHHTSREIRDWTEAQDPASILADSSCLFVRGTGAHGALARIMESYPHLKYDTACSTGGETIVTAGVDCNGRLTDSDFLQANP